MPFHCLQAAFDGAIHRAGYPGTYQGVFPVKCNHDKCVISSIVEFGRPYGFGLEVGSKAELLLAAAAIADGHYASPAEGKFLAPLLICNGYKDSEYMELAMRCGQLGANVIIVMEQPEEVQLAILAAAAVPNSPTVLGIRAKLTTAHPGHWGTTSGDAAKFGLSPRQIVAAVRRLDAAGILHRLELLHFHVGSQMSALNAVRDALAEGGALYAELHSLGAHGLRYLDVGGGLAIDYDGSGSEAHTSRAYSLDSYAAAVVTAVEEACARKALPRPTLVSESGRALASHHAVVIFDVVGGLHQQKEHGEEEDGIRGSNCGEGHSGVIDAGESSASEDGTVIPSRVSSEEATSPVIGAQQGTTPTAGLNGSLQRVTLDGVTDLLDRGSRRHLERSPQAEFLLKTLKQVLNGLEPSEWSVTDALRNVDYYKLEALRAFKLGLLSLEDRVAAEELVTAVHRRARSFAALHALVFPSEGNNILGLPSHLDSNVFNKTTLNESDQTSEVRTLHVNMSVFRSAVDCWAIGQVFPILPLSRLDEEPTGRAVLADLTCDSDGKLDTFINPSGGKALKALPVHMGGHRGVPYRLAMFLTGVYQETMGSPHNLFGSLNSATIRLRPSGGLPAVPSSMSLCSDTGMGSECSTTAVASGLETRRLGAWIAQGGLEFVVERVVHGESVATVLSRVGHDAAALLRSVRSMAAGAAASGRASEDAVDAAMAYVEARMEGYTYMAS